MSEILITQDDQGHTFEADLGDLIVIRLAENLATGYGWELEAVESPVLEFLDSDYSPEPGELMGRGGTRTLHFQAKSSGSQQIQLGYRRPWEDVAVEHFNVNIRVH